MERIERAFIFDVLTIHFRLCLILVEVGENTNLRQKNIIGENTNHEYSFANAKSIMG